MAVVAVYAPPPGAGAEQEGEPAGPGVPDVLVLRNVGAATREEASYWREWPVVEARHAAGPVWRLGFGVEQNEADGEVHLDDSFTLYELVHRPGGVTAGERVLASGYAAGQVFRFDGTDASMLGSLVATRFELGEGVLFPGSTLNPATPAGEAPLRTVATAPGSLASENDPLQRGVEAEGIAFGPRVDRALATWPAGTAPPAGEAPTEGGATAEGAAAAAAEPAPPEEVWVTLIAADTPEEDGTDRAAVRFVEQVGTWSVDGDGAYTFAAYPDEGGPPGEGAMPRLVGKPAPFVFLWTGLTPSPADTLYAHVSYGKLPMARVHDLGRRVVGGGIGGPLTPLGFFRDPAAEARRGGGCR